MSSIKTRKHFVILDMAFSAFLGFMFFVVFCYMCYSWGKSDDMFSFASSNIIGAIFFTFLSIFCWVSALARPSPKAMSNLGQVWPSFHL